MAKKKRRGQRYGPLQQATDLANLQFGPQQRSLLTLLRDLRATRDLEVGASQGLASSMVNLAEQQRQPIGAAYDRSAQQVTESGGLAQQAVAGIKGTPYASALLAGIAAEPQRASTRIASERGAASADLGKQQQQALASGKYGVQSATRSYKSDRQKVEAERQGLFQDKGKFIRTTFADLSKAEQKAALDAAGLDRQIAADEAADADRDASRGIAQQNADTQERNSRKGPKRTPKHTAEVKRNAKRDLRKAKKYMDDLGLKKGGERAQEVIGFLNNKKGIDPLLGQAAAELKLYGKLKPQTRKKLMKNYGIGGL